MKNFCDKFCYKRFNYYNNRELKIKQTRDWVINNKERVAKYKREYFQNNYIPKRGELNQEQKEIIERLKKEGRRIWANENSRKPEVQEKIKAYRRLPHVKKRQLEKWKRWAKENKEQLKIRSRLQSHLKKEIKRYIKRQEPKIPNKPLELSFSITARHLYNTIPEDYGKIKYHIDHIRPICSFDLSKPEECLKAYSIENTRWLTAEENLKKGAKDKLMSRRRKNAK